MTNNSDDLLWIVLLLLAPGGAIAFIAAMVMGLAFPDSPTGDLALSIWVLGILGWWGILGLWRLIKALP